MAVNIKRCAHSTGTKSFLWCSHAIEVDLPLLEEKTLPQKTIGVEVVAHNASIDMKSKQRQCIFLGWDIKFSPKDEVLEE